MSLNSAYQISFWSYLLAAIGYTGYVFTANAPWVFTKRNIIPGSRIVVVHSMFVGLLIALMNAMFYAYPALPDWLVETRRSLSQLEILLLMVVAILLQKIESRLIYVEYREVTKKNSS